MSPAHGVLRAATAGRHAATEDAFASFDLGTADGYSDFLRAQASAVWPIEAWLETTTIDAALPDWPFRRRGTLIRGDLAALGVSEPTWRRKELPGDPLGAVYVLEGSRFGGHVLARRTAAPAFATRFLRDRGVPGGWRGLWEAIEAEIAAGRRTLAAMVEASEAAFGLFGSAVAQHTRAPADWMAAQARAGQAGR